MEQEREGLHSSGLLRAWGMIVREVGRTRAPQGYALCLAVCFLEWI